MTLYNEIEPYCQKWLSNLVNAGHIADGAIIPRSIKELTAADVKHARQAHYFAGLGAWSYALRLAGWPDGRPVWTGSCPCQPFSAAGKGGGFGDERHLWPDWFRLIEECRPPVVFGEQVASADGLRWFDLVYADLERAGYTVGAAVLPAASVGAPHGRHRLWFGAYRAESCTVGVGNSDRAGLGERRGAIAVSPELAPAEHGGSVAGVGQADARRGGMERGGGFGGPRSASREDEGEAREWKRGRVAAGAGGASGIVADALRDGPSPRPRIAGSLHETEQLAGPRGFGHWSDVEWLPCRDGKARPAKPGIFPLASRAPARVARLRAAGNAIVPQVAAAFIRAFTEVMDERAAANLS